MSKIATFCQHRAKPRRNSSGKLHAVPLLELAEVAPDVPGPFAQHVTKTGEAAFHAWRDADLLIMLRRLLENEEAEGGAACELGLAHLARAFDGENVVTILAGLDTARLLFERAREADEDRSDARLSISD